jgi:hypothetical protein
MTKLKDDPKPTPPADVLRSDCANLSAREGWSLSD